MTDPLLVGTAAMTLLFQTDRKAELVDKLYLHKPYVFFNVYELMVPACAGDLVSVSAQYEATNDLGFNVMLAEYMCVASPPDSTKILFIRPMWAAGENVTPNMHHAVRRLSGHFTAAEDNPTVCLVAYCAASPAKQRPGQYLTIMQGYGGISAVVSS